MQIPEKSFISHILRYVGVGLISGSIVHAGTLGGSVTRYIVLIVIGIIAFTVGTYMEQDNKINKDLLHFIAISVIISIGTGMVSGGTQHYLDNPLFASYILPIGLLLGYIAYMYRDFKQNISVKRVFLATVIASTLFFSLYSISHIVLSLENHHAIESGHHD